MSRKVTQAGYLPKRQKGVALVISMVLLAVCLLLGVSSIQSSLLDERLAGNHREAVLARMTAEAGIAAVVNDSIPSTGPGDWESLLSLTSFSSGSDEDSKASYMVDYKKEDSYVFLRSTGFYGSDDRVAESTVIAKYRVAESSIFDTAVVGCEGVSISGGSRIASYNSKEKEWDPVNPGRNAGVQALGDDANIILAANERIYGDVEVTGDITIGGNKDASSKIYGNVLSGGGIVINGDGVVHGNISAAEGDATLNHYSEVTGNIEAGSDINFVPISQDSNALDVGGNVTAGGKVSSTGGSMEGFVKGTITENSSASFSGPNRQSECDIMSMGGVEGIENIMDAYSDVKKTDKFTTNLYPYEDWVISPGRVTRSNMETGKRKKVNERKMEKVEFNGREMSMLKTDDFEIAYKSVTISGGDVALYVDGDFNIGNQGGPGLIIEDGSTLTVFVTGKINIGHAISMDSTSSVNDEGNAVFSVYSGGNSDVIVNGGSDLVASIYAPLADVSVNSGGGVFGSLRGKTLDIYGDGTIAYDEALGMMGSSDGGENGSGPEFVSWGEPIN